MTRHEHRPATGPGPGRRRAAAGVLTALLVLTAAGCADDVTDRTVRGHGSLAMMHAGVQGPMAETWVRDEAGFLAVMVAHHEEAVVAARELRRSDRPAMRRFGDRIVVAQTREIRLMRQWLAAWYPGTPPAEESRMMSDLSSLDAADLDRTFLREMIRHHMAAVMMSQRLIRAGLVRHPVVGGLARGIARTQADEIVRMHRWLRRMR